MYHPPPNTPPPSYDNEEEDSPPMLMTEEIAKGIEALAKQLPPGGHLEFHIKDIPTITEGGVGQDEVLIVVSRPLLTCKVEVELL